MKRPPQRRTPTDLTAKQARFVAEFLKDLNATQAAVRCGYSVKSARKQGYRLSTNAAIRVALADAEAKLTAANQISATRTLEEDRRIAYNNPLLFLTATGNLKPPSEWTPEMAAAVSKFEVCKKNVTAGDGHTDTVVKIWFWNKVQALELLFKHHGLLQPEGEGDGPLVPVYLLPAGARVETK